MHTIFQIPAIDANTTAPALPTIHGGTLSPKHGLRHHKLTTRHDPNASGLLSAESAESAEVVQTVPAVAEQAAAPAAAPEPALASASASGSASDASASAEVPVVVVKRDVPAAPISDISPISFVPVCPGKVRFFK